VQKKESLIFQPDVASLLNSTLEWEPRPFPTNISS